MRIAVIGGSGFIGSRLTRLLLKNEHEVGIIDKNPSKLFNHLVTIADIRDKEKLTESLKGYQVIIHLAAEHKDNVSPASLYYDVNVKGTENIIGAAKENNINSLIFTSSVAVYGLNKMEPDEDSPVDPFGDYGKSKWQAEELLRQWQNKEQNRSLTVIRPVVVFGEDNRGNVYNLLKQIVSGKFLMIGDGKNKKSMAYVGNVASFLARQLNNPPGYHLYNYADKPDMDMKQLVELVNDLLGKPSFGFHIPYPIGLAGGYFFDVISALTGKELPVSSVRVKKFCATTQFSAQKALDTGFTPATDLINALKKTIRYEFFHEQE